MEIQAAPIIILNKFPIHPAFILARRGRKLNSLCYQTWQFVLCVGRSRRLKSDLD